MHGRLSHHRFQCNKSHREGHRVLPEWCNESHGVPYRYNRPLHAPWPGRVLLPDRWQMNEAGATRQPSVRRFPHGELHSAWQWQKSPSCPTLLKATRHKAHHSSIVREPPSPVLRAERSPKPAHRPLPHNWSSRVCTNVSSCLPYWSNNVPARRVHNVHRILPTLSVHWRNILSRRYHNRCKVESHQSGRGQSETHLSLNHRAQRQKCHSTPPENECHNPGKVPESLHSHYQSETHTSRHISYGCHDDYKSHR